MSKNLRGANNATRFVDTWYKLIDRHGTMKKASVKKSHMRNSTEFADLPIDLKRDECPDGAILDERIDNSFKWSQKPNTLETSVD